MKLQLIMAEGANINKLIDALNACADTAEEIGEITEWGWVENQDGTQVTVSVVEAEVPTKRLVYTVHYEANGDEYMLTGYDLKIEDGLLSLFADLGSNGQKNVVFPMTRVIRWSFR
jgi:hypothetical protein